MGREGGGGGEGWREKDEKEEDRRGGEGEVFVIGSLSGGAMFDAMSSSECGR